MISADWELTAALAVLRQAQQEAAALRGLTCDMQMLDAAERRYCSALRIVERIRAAMNGDAAHRRNDYTLSASQYGEIHG